MSAPLALFTALCLYTINGLILPITKPDGSLDVSSLLSHIALLEQSLENKASAAEVIQLKEDLAKSKGGSTFTRWGRTSCPADSSLVYKGYTGGTWSVENGGSGSIVCLPEHPIYANHTSGHNYLTSHIYGTEFDSDYPGNPLQNLYQEDIPCVVCESSRSKSVMIPGRNRCYPGWSLEYWGYLLGGHPTHAAAKYICIDSDPEAIPGGQANTNGRTLFMVESRCGALPCPPYEDTWEVTCAVCSK